MANETFYDFRVVYRNLTTENHLIILLAEMYTQYKYSLTISKEKTVAGSK